MTVQSVPPIGSDLAEHVLDESCPCDPTLETWETLDGSSGEMLVHHQLDGATAKL